MRVSCPILHKPNQSGPTNGLSRKPAKRGSFAKSSPRQKLARAEGGRSRGATEGIQPYRNRPNTNPWIPRPMTRFRNGQAHMGCYRCGIAVPKSADKCHACGCVAFFHGQKPQNVWSPVWDASETRPDIPFFLLELDEIQRDRYLDVVPHENGRRRKHYEARS